MSGAQVLLAGAILRDPRTLLLGGGVVVRGGEIIECIRGLAAARRRGELLGARPVELSPGVLAPGLVDAHAHLDLTALAGEVPAQGGFSAWVGRLIELRAAQQDRELAAGVTRGADRLLRSGTTLVGDVDSTGCGAEVLSRHPLSAVLFREVLDGGDPRRSAEAFDRVARPLSAGEGLVEGLSPHAPFSVAPALLARLGTLARERRMPVAVHWSETPAEVEWLRDGSGPLAERLIASPRRRGVELLGAAGLLGPRTLLVHGNLPERGEARRIAEAGASLVHCPGTHRFFGREPFPLARYRSAGVRLALGTDSLASNTTLDMRHEMALLREGHPELDPGQVWAMATEEGAAALGWGTRAGSLLPGRRADLALFDAEARELGDCLDRLTSGYPDVLGVWSAGRTTVEIRSS